MNNSFKLIKVFATFEEGGPDGLYEVDAIEFDDGVIGLVYEWLDGHPKEGLSTPMRLILPLLPNFGQIGDRLVLQTPVPKAVLEQEQVDGYEIHILPNLYVLDDSLKQLPDQIH